MDSNRFFRIIRDESGQMRGFFESRSATSTVEVVQWVFIHQDFQGK